MVLKQHCLNCVLPQPVISLLQLQKQLDYEQLHGKSFCHENVICLPVTEPENLRAYKVNFVSFSYREIDTACMLIITMKLPLAQICHMLRQSCSRQIILNVNVAHRIRIF